MTDKHSAVEKLVREMLEHRKSVVLQVSGVPQQAIAAVGGLTGLEIQLSQGQEQEKVGLLRTWFREKAKESFLAQRMYRQLPWGKEDSRIDRLRKQAKAQELERIESIARAELKLANRALTYQQQDEDTLLDIDNKLIRHTINSGYFDRGVSLRQYETGISGKQTSAIPVLGGKGVVRIVSDKLGDVFSEIPQDPYDQRELAKYWASGGAPSQEQEKVRIYSRWLYLFHEMAHCQYGLPAEPFCPTPGRLDEKSVKMINRYCVGGLACADVDAPVILNECHSDVYATMVLLEVSGHDPLARKAVEQLLELRGCDQDSADKRVLKWEREGRSGIPDPHMTQWALKRVLDDVQNWKGKSPQELKQLALRYASDGMVDIISAPGRDNIGEIYLNRFSPEKFQKTTLSNKLAYLTYSYANNGDIQGWFDQQDKASPCYELLRKSWEKLLPQLRKILAQDLPQDQQFFKGAKVIDSLRSSDGGIGVVANLIVGMDLPINDQTNENIREMAPAMLLAGNHIRKNWGSPAHSRINEEKFGASMGQPNRLAHGRSVNSCKPHK